jgi:D-glycero-D-manno-heptose 1,7-bisphosphate phosphatase
MNRAVFLDRDGTVIEERNYLHRPEEVVMLPGAAAALQRLQAAGYHLIFVTNQSGVGRGYFSMSDVEAVHAHLAAELAGGGVRVARFYVAPEAPDQPSRGRKPSPQFLFDARDEFKLDLSRCALVGDKLVDLECGWNAGLARCVLVRTGYGAREENKLGANRARARVVDDLAAAAEWILSESDAPSPPA